MDPDETLKQIRQLVKEYNQPGWLDRCDVEQLVELVEALDLWLSKGGFLPAAWRKE